MGWIAVITNAGQSLLAQYDLGGSTLYITKVQTGSGSVAQANMRNSTALVTPVDQGYVSGTQALAAASEFRLAIGPYTSAYTLKEIGLFAKLGESGTETLLALIQADDDGFAIPKSSDFPDFVLRLTAVLAISNTASISITPPAGANVPYGEFEAAERQKMLMLDNIPDTTATPTFDSNGDVTQITHTDVQSNTVRTDVITRTTTELTEVRTLATGEVLTIVTNRSTCVSTYTLS